MSCAITNCKYGIVTDGFCPIKIASNNVFGFVANASAIYPEAKHYFDIGTAIREIADMEGAPTKLIPEQSVIDEKIEAEAQQMQMAQMAQMGNSAADSVNKLAKAQMTEPSALSGMMGR